MLNDYIDLQLMGELYSRGSWGLNVASSYNKRYAYNGRFNMRYNNQISEREGDSTIVKDFWINWSHSPQSTGSSRFSASVNFGTSSYNQNNPTADLRNTLNQDFNSSVSYSQVFKGTPFNLSASSRLQQNVNTGIFNMQLPELALNMNRIYPFKFGRKSSNNPLQKVSFSWNMNATNRITNQLPREPSFDVANFDGTKQDTVGLFEDFSALLTRGQNGIRHRIPVSTSMNIFKYISLSPSFNYDELWYFKELSYQWDDAVNAVQVDTLTGFSRAYSYSGSLSLNTRMYGTKYFRKDAKIQAIRHVLIPTAGMSFSPDFADERYGYYQNVQIDSLGNTRRLSKYENFVYGTPSAGESASAFFSLSNNFEMKVKSKSDTTDEARKVVILDNLSVSSSYNFLADSFQLADITFSARTRLFKNKLNVNFGATVDPYIYQLDSTYFRGGDTRVAQRQRSIYAWNAGQGLGQLTRANLALSMSLNPKVREKEIEEREQTQNLTPEEELQLEFIRNNPELYVDFDIPWDLRINYNINYNKRGYDEATITQAVQFSGSVTFTEKWNMSFSSGFDLQNQEFTQTNFNITRDLHCWQMNFSWTPFGRYESYFLTINAKSALLQDLKVNKQRSWWDN